MEKRKHKSVDWIHKAREENFKKTGTLSSEQLLEKTRKATDDAIKSMGLKVIRPKEPARTR